MKLFHILKNFLTHAPIIQIWDDFIHPDCHSYKKFYKFLNNCGSSSKRIEVEINTSISNKRVGRMMRPEDYEDFYKTFGNWFKENSFKLKGISKISVILWNEVNDRYIVSSKIGGVHMGKGPQDDRSEFQGLSEMSPNDVESLENNYDKENSCDGHVYKSSKCVYAG